MKVTKAIELLRHLGVQLNSKSQYDVYLAILLGIAALEKHHDRDYRGYAAFVDKLPGED